jgi:UDP-N-acetylglucosamine--N-acetylmuramyl-(pentapeptide) pyrophosphoryl-undecaprenol N-acetylglucosamine transferase
MQVVHISGQSAWEQAEQARQSLPPELAERYHAYPYLHAEMSAALAAADVVLSRAGASSLGEYPFFGLPAVLVPYPYAWRYQRVNADYLVQRGAAIMLLDADLNARLLPTIQDLVSDIPRRQVMAQAMRSLAKPDAAATIAGLLNSLAVHKN